MFQHCLTIVCYRYRLRQFYCSWYIYYFLLCKLCNVDKRRKCQFHNLIVHCTNYFLHFNVDKRRTFQKRAPSHPLLPSYPLQSWLLLGMQWRDQRRQPDSLPSGMICRSVHPWMLSEIYFNYGLVSNAHLSCISQRLGAECVNLKALSLLFFIKAFYQFDLVQLQSTIDSSQELCPK